MEKMFLLSISDFLRFISMCFSRLITLSLLLLALVGCNEQVIKTNLAIEVLEESIDLTADVINQTVESNQ